MKIALQKETRRGGLPVTVSGIVFWGMVLVGLLAIVIISNDKERQLNDRLLLTTSLIEAEIVHILEGVHDEAVAGDIHTQIRRLAERRQPHLELNAIRLVRGKDETLVGEIGATDDVQQRQVHYHERRAMDEEKSAQLSIYFPNRQEIITAFRNELFVTIGLGVFTFGFILQQILQKLLTRPILGMVEVASEFSKGNVDARFDESRRDELGYMARFINGALDSMLSEQDASRRVLEQLRESQAALQEQHDLLEVRVTERTRELRAANRELEAYSYSIAHDLRQPLRAIDGFSMLLLEDYAGRLDAEGKSYLKRVRDAAQRMGHLIDDILELSRITRQELHRKTVNLAEEARAIIHHLREDDPDRVIEVQLPDTLYAQGDPALLKVTLQNLLGNAWKYSSENPRARIEFGVNGSRLEPVYFVKDNGIGFDEQYGEKLFQPFERLHNDERFEGTGIGLATVARAVQRMGGEVWARSKESEGAVFYFTLGKPGQRSSSAAAT